MFLRNYPVLDDSAVKRTTIDYFDGKGNRLGYAEDQLVVEGKQVFRIGYVYYNSGGRRLAASDLFSSKNGFRLYDATGQRVASSKKPSKEPIKVHLLNPPEINVHVDVISYEKDDGIKSELFSIKRAIENNNPHK